MHTDQNIRNGHPAQAVDIQVHASSHFRWLRAAAKRGLVWPILVAALVVVAAPHLSAALQLKSVLWISFGIAALSLDLVWGKAGIFSFGQNALFGIGAYAYAVTAINVFPVTHETGTALIVAVAASAAFAGVMGYAPRNNGRPARLAAAIRPYANAGLPVMLR